MAHRRIFLTDKEVAAVLEISDKTLYRIMRGFFPKRTRGDGSVVDLRKAQPDVVCGSRRWRINRLASVLGLTEEEIERRIS